VTNQLKKRNKEALLDEPPTHVKNHKIYTRMKGMRYTCPNSSTRSEVFAFAGSSVG